MAAALASALFLPLQNPTKTLRIPSYQSPLCNHRFPFSGGTGNRRSLKPSLLFQTNTLSEKPCSVSSQHLSSIPSATRNYEFYDAVAEVELRINIGSMGVQSSSDIFVDVDETSLLIRVKASGSLLTLVQTNCLYDKIKPAEAIWYIDEDQLVVNLKKYDPDLTWPDVMESWESLTSGVLQLLKGTSIYIIGDSTDINQKVSSVLANGIGYTPLCTSDLLESYVQQSINSWVIAEGADSVAEAEGVVLESLSSHVRAVVATLGGQHGATRRPDKWRHLHAGFTVWLSKSEAADEASANEEARRHIQDGNLAYSNADVVVKLGGWDDSGAQAAAQACLSALKQLLLSDKQLTGKRKIIFPRLVYKLHYVAFTRMCRVLSSIWKCPQECSERVQYENATSPSLYTGCGSNNPLGKKIQTLSLVILSRFVVCAA